MTTAKLGRNDRCSCGSGKKYKVCCASKSGNRRFSTMMLLVVAVAVVAALLASVFGSGETTGGAGRVWSAEHGHYHDAQ
jgi:hypothetical protein